MSEIKRTDPIAGDIVHVYDGIEEADNELPRWWLAIFIGSILFAFAYYVAYEKLQWVDTPWQRLAAAEAAQRRRDGTVSDADLVAAAGDDKLIASGKQAFITNCVACHGDKAEGKIGPNLTDDRWIHGGSALNVFTTVRDGIGQKGMPAWGPVLGQDNVKAVTAFILTLRNTNVPGKEPQGEVWVAP